MKDYEVTIKLEMECEFTEQVEASCEEEAEMIAKDMVWEDKLTHEIRAASEITSEEYEAEEMLSDFDIYDAEDNFLDVMYDQPSAEAALDEYNEEHRDGKTVGDYAEER
jgi:hypothetical protein